MTPGEFREFAKAMREFGVSKMKMGDMELTLDWVGNSSEKAAYPESLESGVSKESPSVSKEVPEPIKHRVDELTSLLKLNDNDLVDQLFPDKTEETA